MKYLLYISTGALVSAVALISINVWLYPPAAQPAVESDSVLQKENLPDTLLVSLESIGPEDTRENLKKLYADETIDNSHIAGHYFGGVLYQKYGVAGLPYCDTSFSFGCQHQFFGDVIAAEGVGVVSELNDACFSRLPRLAEAFACQHGIGHGLQAYGGYDLDALVQALEVCHELEPTDEIVGCYGGAVMEYNMKTMVSVHNIPPRPLGDDEDAYFPCNAIPDYASQACYYWQSQWWIFALDMEYEPVGRLCDELDEPNRRACFFGIGNRLPSLTMEADEVPKICAAFTTVGDQDDYHICAASAAVTYSESGHRDIAMQICDALNEAGRSQCTDIVVNN